MKSFVKSALFSALGVGCLAIGSGAQTPAPSPPAPPGVVVGQGTTSYVQGAYNGRVITDNGMTLWYGGSHDHETMEIAKKLAAAKTDSEKEKLHDRLIEALNKAFDERQKRQEKEIEALEAQVKRLKEMVGKRQEAKKEIIADRVKQLEREAKGLGW